MESIRIKNLHCLADTGEIPLKPINILVGANSSGKSSFLRTFPLLKQGLNTNKKGPILWLSEDVDFGDFKTAVKRGERNIQLQFNIEQYNVALNIVDNNANDYIDKIVIHYMDQRIQVNISNKNEVENIIINEETFATDLIAVVENRTTILPNFFVREPVISSDIFEHVVIRKHFAIFDDKILDCINEIVSNSLSVKTITNIKDRVSNKLMSRQTTLNLLQEINRPIKWSSIVSKWTIEDKNFMMLNNRLLLSIALPIIENINNKLTKDFRNVSYIAPLRATAERYYRRQNLSLNSIDSRGINLPMFINDLTEMEKKDLREWMQKYFGFYLFTDYSGGHIAISLASTLSGEKINLADSGFGFSQIMPIVIILWTLTSKRFLRRRNKIIRLNNICYYVIEQPELHLHPAFQAKLADVFVSAISLAKENDIELKLILETHSEALINRIGRRISEQLISKEDVSVALFENEPNQEGKNVTLATFTEDGFLENWPIGFFNAD